MLWVVTHSVTVSAVNVSIISSTNCIQEHINYQNCRTKVFKLASSFPLSLFCFVIKQYHCCWNSFLVGVLQLYYSHCFTVCLCDVLKHNVWCNYLPQAWAFLFPCMVQSTTIASVHRWISVTLLNRNTAQKGAFLSSLWIPFLVKVCILSQPDICILVLLNNVISI